MEGLEVVVLEAHPRVTEVQEHKHLPLVVRVTEMMAQTVPPLRPVKEEAVAEQVPQE